TAGTGSEDVRARRSASQFRRTWLRDRRQDDRARCCLLRCVRTRLATRRRSTSVAFGALVVPKPFPAQSASRPCSRTDRALCVWAVSVWLRKRGVHAWLRTDHRNPLSRPQRTNTAEERPAIARCVCAFVSKKFSRNLVSRP